MSSSIEDQINYKSNTSSSGDSTSISTITPATKSRRGRKRITDPILASELRHHRRSRANDRERTRMRLLNEALEHLRTLLPMDSLSCYSSTDLSHNSAFIEDKLTKIETLRTASAYIRLLTDLLEDNSNSSATSNLYSYNIPIHHPQQPQQQQHQQLYQYSSYFPCTSSYSYYNSYS